MPWIFDGLDSYNTMYLRNTKDGSVIEVEYTPSWRLWVKYQGNVFYIRRENLKKLLEMLDSDAREKLMEVIRKASKLRTYWRIADNLSKLVENWDTEREKYIRKIERGIKISEGITKSLEEAKHILSGFEKAEYVRKWKGKWGGWTYHCHFYYDIRGRYLILTENPDYLRALYVIEYLRKEEYREGRITLKGLLRIYEGKNPKIDEKKEIPEKLKEGLAQQNPEEFGVFSDYIKRLQAEIVLRKV